MADIAHRAGHVFSADELAAKLEALPRWSYKDGAIERCIKTASFKATLMVVTTIGHLCEVAWHHPEMIVTFNKVVVRLWTHDAKGITAKDIELATKIDALLDWQPKLEGGALDGTPVEPRHAYLRYD